MHAIEFKTKPYKVRQSDDLNDYRMAIDFKRKLGRTDCDMRPIDHRYYNSDLFVGMLNREYKRIIGEYKEWAYLDALPNGVSVDTSKFLAVVRIELPESFK
jgi:hypothetical protein